MPRRFVILEHHHEGVHYDLMLEVNGQLKTWRVPQPLATDAAQVVHRIFDHRLAYLDYEGPVSGNRGEVKRWDSGTYEGSFTDDGPMSLLLHGRHCQGWLRLERLAGSDWRLNLEPMKAARPVPGETGTGRERD